MQTGNAFHRPAVRVAFGVGIVLSLPLAAMLIAHEVVWSLADFVVAGVLLAAIGISIELAVGKAGSRVLAGAVAGIGIAATVLGEADDAPGLVLLGILLIVSGS